MFVFENTQRGGSFIAAGDVNGDCYVDIICGGGPDGGPRVRIINSKTLFNPALVPDLEAVNLDDEANLRNGLVLSNFFAFRENDRGGVRVAARDLDGDALADPVVGSGYIVVYAQLATGLVPYNGQRRGIVKIYRGSEVMRTTGEPANALELSVFDEVTDGVFVG